MKKTGKLVALLLALTIIVSSFAGTSVFAADTSSDFSIVNGILIKYTGNGGNVTIPDNVISIGSKAFSDCTELTGITIPSSVTNIKLAAFFGCFKLANISVSDANQNFCVSNGILYNKSKSILVLYPAALTQTSYTIPNGVTEIGDTAFAYCTNLKSITIPSGVKKIGDLSFVCCPGLANVTIPGSVTNIGTLAFELTPWMNHYKGDFVVVNRMLIRYKGTDKAITIPSNVTCIADAAFYECSKITSIRIPNSITKIRAGAFYGCTGLTSVTIPGSVTQIEESAFQSCTNLASITIPKSVVSLGDTILYNTKASISGYEGSAAQAYAKKNKILFKSLDGIVYKGVTYKGSVTLDTQSYRMAPKNTYVVGVRFAGNGKTKKFQVTSSSSGVATVTKLPNGNYKIVAVKPGTTYIICNVYDGTKLLTHASVKVTVAKGVKQGGVATRSTSYFN